jgi:hypothetical protein
VSAAVRIEGCAFADERFVTLARLAGLADADHARGKMARLWRQCTDHHTEILPIEIIESVLGSNACDVLVKSGLGEQTDHGFRIRGTSGRIEWLEKARRNGKKGGKARAKRMLSESLANQEKEKEKEISSESLETADKLRAAIVAQQPNHKLAKDWTNASRRKWAEQLETLNLKDGRSWTDIALTIHWLFYEQTGDYKFVVQSPSALAEKWDRIEAQRKRPTLALVQPATRRREL